MKTVQYFTDEYLDHCKKMTLEQRLRFLDDFRKMQHSKSPSKLISMKVPEDLLEAFKEKCQLEQIPYQTKIKELMYDWLGKLR